MKTTTIAVIVTISVLAVVVGVVLYVRLVAQKDLILVKGVALDSGSGGNNTFYVRVKLNDALPSSVPPCSANPDVLCTNGGNEYVIPSRKRIVPSTNSDITIAYSTSQREAFVYKYSG
jgi:hypothetical protein